MGLTDSDRKELESLIKAATRDPKMPIGLARKMVPNQGNIEDLHTAFSPAWLWAILSHNFRIGMGGNLTRMK